MLSIALESHQSKRSSKLEIDVQTVNSVSHVLRFDHTTLEGCTILLYNPIFYFTPLKAIKKQDLDDWTFVSYREQTH